jgi:hypothetical protein
MLLFRNKRTKEIEVQRLLTKILNANCRALDALREGPRSENRADLTLVVIVIPRVGERPDVDQAFGTVTKEVSSTGMSLVLSQKLNVDQVFLGLEVEREMKYVQAEVRHQSPLGAGLTQAGVRLTEIVGPADFPELAAVKI